MPFISAGFATMLILLSSPPAAWGFSTPGRVSSDTVLNVRSGPGTDKPVVGTLSNDAAVTVECQVWGQAVGGTQTTSPYWDRIGNGQYVADGFIAWSPSRPAVPWCASSCPASASTTASTGLNVRTGPGFSHGVVSQLASGSPVMPTCQSWGSDVSGDSVWLSLPAGFVSAHYVAWSPELPWLPWCGQEPPVVTAGSTSAFIAAAVAPAREGQRAHRVPASVTIAQAILESGWGRSTLTRDDHNYFGMKCFGGPGPVATGCRSYPTTECSGGNCYPTTGSFRAYRSPAESYVDHGRQLASMERYSTAMGVAADPERFAREIHQAGYATSPTYADQLISLMRQYRLHQYDVW